MRLKRILKTALQATVSSAYDAIVVASMGRSGSTLVFDAVCGGLSAARFGPLHRLGAPLVTDYAWDLSNCQLHSGVVYKTHALADEMPAIATARAIFVFTRPSDAVISLFSCSHRYGAEWIDRHLSHLRATGPLEDAMERDVLRIEEQIFGWLTCDSAPVLGLRYEAIWQYTDKISEFVGFPVHLPDRRSRNSPALVDNQLRYRIADTYRDLDKRVGDLPDWFLVGKS